ncbi:hypothetical protein DL766_009567 [Monosporascus sp. MC13-8B]|uniref:DNA-directed RNA polymerase n=1 Tax=Monosporascus cannonballus TaxID=155416 RepID=A0ABY0HFZ0_9PEZI|nr:hypothetical protein DL763_009507 [Monosporascus cannonballus]RYO92620.1 hypothetical protein DL762_001523 [Monosporascus cannonballus]RYP14839.1 hypothetical protein DL766_009567 [Monosporascus sp. MC13-8B]
MAAENFLQQPLRTSTAKAVSYCCRRSVVKPNHEPFPRVRSTLSGLPGGIEDMLSVFDACLQVCKLDRAALVLERLGTLAGALPQHELVGLHNRYLRASLERAFEQSDAKWAQNLHRWFELQVRGPNLPHTAETIACMLKVSILSARGDQLERLINRYMDMMPGDDAMRDVLSEDDILTQQDLGTITSIYQPASSLSFGDWDVLSSDPDNAQPLETDKTTPSVVPEASETLQVRPVEQKGLGLKTLRSILSFFEDIKGMDLSKLSVDERREIQARLEKDCVDAAIKRWREENQALRKMGMNTALSTNALNSQLYEWHLALENKLQLEFDMFDVSEQRSNKNQEDMDRCLYAPFLRQSTPTRVAAVTILSVLNTFAQQGADKGLALSIVLNNLAKAVEEDVRQLVRQNAMPPRKGKSAKRQRRVFHQSRQQAEVAPDAQKSSEAESASNVVECSAYDTRHWPVYIRAKVGAVLLGRLLDSAKVNVVREHPETKAFVSQVQPAMAHATMHRRGKKVGVILPNKWLVDLLKREPRGDFLARHLPMLVEPEPWTKFDKGGFLVSPSQLVRIKNGEKDQRIYAEAAVDRGDMEQVSKGLDVLGRTAWQINQPVFDVMLEAWNTGEKLANIPPLHPSIRIPPEPAESEDMMHRREWFKAVKAAENLKSGMHSERCFMNFQLEIARALKDQTFYFPHNMDFRGRAYPIPTYLNHMGADHTRGLLRFAVGKELGENGLRWLKVHLANVFGFDKASLREREAFTVDNLANISDSVTNPLNGKRWWLKAEDPWQCLATCFELKAALDSPDPTKFVSHLPVHQDGTCNGLQHYAALGGDLWGAQQVNLVPGERPADVYSAVADLVKQSVAEDVESDNFMGKAVDGKITRKVVKQTVMTNVYGVTFVGAKAQVLKQLDAAYPNLQEETGVPATVLASYIATKIFKALSTMFRGAHDIQYWLGECAGRVCRALTPEQLDQVAEGPAPSPVKSRTKKTKSATEELLDSFRSTIIWTTPLRMPVVQPYRKSGTRIVQTSLQDLNLQVPDRSDPVNRRKQLQAFPPNFIHSLDASHMLLSALECDELGLSFAAVHDSFWTHAADVDVMNRVLRDAFIRIHSEDVIGRLAAEFEARYKGSLYLANVDPASNVGKKIKELRKKKKMALRDELLQERERQRLLQSEDPEEVRKGQAMVTPASLFEEESKIQPLSSIEDMDQVALGHIPSADEGATVALAEEESEEAARDMADGTEARLLRGEDPELTKTMINATDFELKLTGATKRPERSDKPKTPLQFWLPLTFPEIPKKGDFDVSRLKTSEYFFS